MADRAGIMAPLDGLNQKSEMIDILRSTFGPSSSEPLTLEEELEALSEDKLKLVLRIAPLVKWAHSWNSSEPYDVLVERMYKRLDSNTKRLVAEILQDADPVEEPVTPTPDKRAAALSKAYSEYQKAFELGDTLTVQNAKAQTEISGPEQVSVVDGEDSEEGPGAFLKRIATKAKKVAAELGIDPRIVLDQAALETGWGASVKGNNLFGIKSHGKDTGLMMTTHEVVDGDRVELQDRFRVYDSYDESISDYGEFLRQNKRYRPFLEADTLDKQITALGKSGYATDPEYANKIAYIAKSNRLKAFLS